MGDGLHKTSFNSNLKAAVFHRCYVLSLKMQLQIFRCQVYVKRMELYFTRVNIFLMQVELDYVRSIAQDHSRDRDRMFVAFYEKRVTVEQ